MGLNKRLAGTLAASGAVINDERLTGSPSAASVKWAASTGTGNTVRYTTSNNPNSSYSSTTVGTDYIQDLQWDGFTWIAATGSGIYQTKNSGMNSGWVQVVSGGSWNNITPVPGGNLVFNSGSQPRGTYAYTTALNPSTPSSSDWSTASTPSIGSNYIMSTAVSTNNIVIGRRYDVSGTAFYYSQADDWFLGSGLSGWISGNPAWGYFIATNGTEFVGTRRETGMFYSSGIGNSTTENQPGGVGGTIYGFPVNYTNGYWVTGTNQYGHLWYKTSYNGGWSTNNTFSSTKTNTKYHSNGSYWAAGMNYSVSNNQAIRVQSTLSGSPSYTTQSQLGGESFGYVRAFVSSLQKNKGAWTDFGSSSPTFG